MTDDVRKMFSQWWKDSKMNEQSDDHLYAVAREAFIAGRADRWQPIDTAPEGEYVLTTGFIGNDPALGRWQDVAKREADLWFCQTEDQLYPPTHWMPLPEPPK